MPRREYEDFHEHEPDSSALRKCTNTLEAKTYIRGLIVEILNSVEKQITSASEQLQEETGLCGDLGKVLLYTELQSALNHSIAIQAAWSIKQGHSKASVAKTMGKDTSNLMKRSQIGSDIEKMLNAYKALRNSKAESLRVEFHDGYKYDVPRSDAVLDNDPYLEKTKKDQ